MKKVLSILLTFLMLLSSSKLAYAKHFCGEFEMISKITLGQEHLSCGMVVPDTACGDEHTKDHDCCDNEYVQVTTDETVTFSQNIPIPLDVVVAYVAVFQLQLNLKDSKEKILFTGYDPPPLIKDIPVLYETFLI